jgi:type IV pilus assembly protein PilM
VLTGPAVAIPGFAERLADELRMPVDAIVVAGGDGADLGRLTVAAGLAVEETP